ncbi:MAG: glycosyltransferase family 2 protein [Chitinophagaceae bacterium]
MNEQPLVTVIVPYYNNDNEKFLHACFNSIKNQSYASIELIVVDDGSSEKAASMLREFQAEYTFLLLKQKNKGISGALNTGIQHANGKYISCIAADDFWAREKIEQQVNYLESAGPEVAACCTNGYYVFENDPSKTAPSLNRILQPGDLTFEGILKLNAVMAISVMIRKEIFSEIGLFDENSVIEDWDMWLRLTDKYVMGYLPAPLVYYRRHSNNRSNNFDKSWYDSVYYIFQKWKHKNGQREAVINLKLAALNNFSRHQKLAALKIACSNPQLLNHWLYWRGFFKILIPGFLYSKKE